MSAHDAILAYLRCVGNISGVNRDMVFQQPLDMPLKRESMMTLKASTDMEMTDGGISKKKRAKEDSPRQTPKKEVAIIHNIII